MIFNTKFDEHEFRVLEILSSIISVEHGQTIKILFNHCNM